jgi:LPS export ABC transporter protein LptC
MRIIRFILLLAFGYLFYWTYERFFVAEGLFRNLGAGFKIPEMRILGVHLEAYKPDGVKEFELFGPEAVLYDKEKRINVINPTLRIFSGDDIAEIVLLAKEANRYETETEYLEMKGRVEGTRVTEIPGSMDVKLEKLFTERLIFYPKAERIVSPADFKYITDKHIIEGHTFWYRLNDGTGEVSGNFSGRLYEDEAVIAAEMEMGLVSATGEKQP